MSFRTLSAVGLAPALALTIPVVAGTIAPSIELPAPGGAFAVGTTVRQWHDAERDRALRVRIWYPAVEHAHGSRAPYVPDLNRFARALSDAYRSRVARVETHGIWHAAAAAGPFPVALFSHGLGSYPPHYTVLAEALASHGYVVFAVNHPGGSRVTLDRRGRVIPLAPEWSAWVRDEDAMAAAIERWSDDERFVLDRIVELADGDSTFAGRLDLERIAAVGHSLGGSSAVLTAQRDRRIKAVVNLDGTVRGVHRDRPLAVPGLFLLADRAALNREQAARNLGLSPDGLDRFLSRLDVGRDRLRARASQPVVQATIRRAHHNHFGDRSIVFGERTDVGPVIDARRAARIVRTVVRVGLDRIFADGTPGAVVGDLGRRFPALVGASPPLHGDTAGRVRVNGIELFYRTMGSGPPVIVLHGGPSPGHGYLLPWFGRLAGDHRVVLYDQRGTGRSTAPSDSAAVTRENFLADLDGLRAALGFGRFHLVGHSWGGQLAMGYALTYPEQVRTLTLVSSTEPGRRYLRRVTENLEGRRTPEDSTALARLFRSEGFERGEAATLNRIYQLIYRSWLGDPGYADSLSFDVTGPMATAGRAAARLVVANSPPVDYWTALDTLAVPALVIHGDRDPVPVAMARDLAETLPDARFLRLAGVGHFPFVERPATVFRAIRRFLRDAGVKGER